MPLPRPPPRARRSARWPRRSCAQDTTSRGVRIGLTYDPGSKPGVVVLPVTRRARRLDPRRSSSATSTTATASTRSCSSGSAAQDAARAPGPNWPLLARLGAAAAVAVTPTPSGFHVAVYNVATKQTALVKDFPSTAAPDSRAWRAALHRIADELEEAFTGVRGIARTRIAFERGRRIWVVDIDGEGAMPLSDAGTPMSPAWHPHGRAIAYATCRAGGHLGARPVERPRADAGERAGGVHLARLHAGRRERRLRAWRGDGGRSASPRSLSGGGGRRLSVGRGSDNVSPSFSPDGRRIAFMSGRAGHPEIYTMDADGTNVDLLTPLAFGENPYRASPDWSPDGRLVAFQSHDRRTASRS